MTPMTTDQEPNWTKNIAAGWQVVRESRIFRFVVWTRWILSIGLTIALILWQAYVLGQDISANLTEDYNKVQASQQTLLQDTQEFRDGLLNPNIDVPMDSELKALREKALTTIAALAGMRAPSNRIEDAKNEYRDALQELIAVSNRLSRGEVEGMAAPLHDALQSVENEGGDLNVEVSYFQGGMWPQLKAAVF